MKRFIISFVLFFAVVVIYAESGTLTVTSVESTPVTGLTLITYDLQIAQIPAKVNTTYNISVEVSFDGGDTYTAIQSEHLSGDVEEVIPGTGKQIIWDGGIGFPNRYSEETKVRLTALSANAGTFVDARDGQIYKWVKIGNQVWMAENLRYLPAVAGPGTGSETDPYYYVYGYDGSDVTAAKLTDNYQNYGVLYNWPAAMAYGGVFKNGNVQGVCPTGWHVPSHDELTQLEQYVCNQLGNSDCVTKFPYDHSTWGFRGTNEGNALKSCRQVGSPLGGCNTSDHPRWNFHSTYYGFDEFGFSAFPGGYRGTGGIFYNIGKRGYWWSATEDSATDAWHRLMGRGSGDVGRFSRNKADGISLRCVRD